MNYNTILITTNLSIATITINRPDKLNALNRETIAELHKVLSLLAKDSAVKAIIITGSGERAFVAGADIAEFSQFSEKEGKKLASKGQNKLFDYIDNFNTPVIAAINGFALGGGLELAMACHFRVASDTAKMGLPEVSLGIIPGYGGTQRLPQLIGKGRALEMILTAGMINATEAHTYGLVNHITTLENLLPLCTKIAEKIIKNAPIAMALAMKAVNAGFNEMADGYKEEINAFGACFGTDDFKEGTTAFLEKRKALFTGS